MNGYMYEHFVRNALGCKDRGDDLAGLSEADIYNTSYRSDSLNKLKIGTGYSIIAYNRKYENEKKLRDPDDYEKMNEFLEDVLKSNTGEEIGEIIEEYQKYQKELDDLQNSFSENAEPVKNV